MPIILANALFIAIVAAFGLRYILSFEVAFLGTLAVAYSSYRSILGRIEGQDLGSQNFGGAKLDGAENVENSAQDLAHESFAKHKNADNLTAAATLKNPQDSLKTTPLDSHDSHEDSQWDLALSTQDSPKDSRQDSPQDSQVSPKPSHALKDFSQDSRPARDSPDSPAAKNAPPTPDNLPKKARFLLGIRASFGIFRLLSYGFIVLSAVALINNGAFFVVPFLLGVLGASVAVMAACALRA